MITEHMKKAIYDFKFSLENAIKTAAIEDKVFSNGLKAKESLIRSSRLINLIHDAIKLELFDLGIEPERVFPPVNLMSPELKIAGFLKKKDQDVCVVPKGVEMERRLIDWGPLKYENQYDEYGQEFSEQTLVINLRSQMSSLKKNADTLFERTFAEPMNLHLIYPEMVIGEVYIIPLVEYDEVPMRHNNIVFKNAYTDITKYISFFSALSGRENPEDDLHRYERCALIIVDFRGETPKIYTKTSELIEDDLVPNDFNINFDNISIDGFTEKLVEKYKSRFNEQ